MEKKDSTNAYLPKNVPNADLAIVSEVHNDFLLYLPLILKDSGTNQRIASFLSLNCKHGKRPRYWGHDTAQGREYYQCGGGGGGVGVIYGGLFKFA